MSWRISSARGTRRRFSFDRDAGGSPVANSALVDLGLLEPVMEQCAADQTRFAYSVHDIGAGCRWRIYGETGEVLADGVQPDMRAAELQALRVIGAATRAVGGGDLPSGVSTARPRRAR
jgi:hypothetical protein